MHRLHLWSETVARKVLFVFHWKTTATGHWLDTGHGRRTSMQFCSEMMRLTERCSSVTGFKAVQIIFKKIFSFQIQFPPEWRVVVSTGSWCGWWWWVDDDDVDDNNHNDVVHQEGHATAEQQIVGGGDGVGVGAPASVVHLQDHATECLIVDAAPACCYRHSDGFLSWYPGFCPIPKRTKKVEKEKSWWYGNDQLCFWIHF